MYEDKLNSQFDFVKKRLRAKPVSYTVDIAHFVHYGEWSMRVGVNDVGPMDAENRKRVAADLRYAAQIIEEDESEASPRTTDNDR